jgi:hypothetical protein
MPSASDDLTFAEILDLGRSAVEPRRISSLAAARSGAMPINGGGFELMPVGPMIEALAPSA